MCIRDRTDTNQAEDLVAYLNDNGFTAQTIDEIMVAEDTSGETLGYAFTVTDSEGYGLSLIHI